MFIFKSELSKNNNLYKLEFFYNLIINISKQL